PMITDETEALSRFQPSYAREWRYLDGRWQILLIERMVDVAANSGDGKSEPWLTVNFNRGIPQIETNFTDKDWGAITPGPFIVYPKGGSEDTYYNTHEPGH